MTMKPALYQPTSISQRRWWVPEDQESTSLRPLPWQLVPMRAARVSTARPQLPLQVPKPHLPPRLTRDRFRTMINVLGDALAAGIMAHICRKDFAQDTGTEVRAVPPSQPGCPKAPAGGARTKSSTHQLGSLQPTPPCLWAPASYSGAEVTNSSNS